MDASDYKFQPPLPLIEKILGVTRLEDYPEGVRAGLKKLYLESVSLSSLDNRSFGHLLQAGAGKHFTRIPGSVLLQSTDTRDLVPMDVVQAANERVAFLTDAVHLLLNILAPEQGHSEPMEQGETFHGYRVHAEPKQGEDTGAYLDAVFKERPTDRSPMGRMFEEVVKKQE